MCRHLQAILVSTLLWSGLLEHKCGATVVEILNHTGDNFVVLGDWGRIPHYSRLRDGVRNSLVTWADVHHPDFVLSTGDNFYPRGIANLYDPKIDIEWRDYYLEGWLSRVPWYISVGNHDYMGNVSAQVKLSEIEPRWILPGQTWYDFHRAFIGDVSVHFIVLDTELLRYGYHYSHHFKDDVAALANIQLDFLKTTLKMSKADWKIVVGHHPVYTSGLHGKYAPRRDVMKTEVDPILKQYNVDLYLSGHDHNLQHIKYQGFNYVISGGGGGVLYKQDEQFAKKLNISNVKIINFTKRAGFVTIHVIKDKLKIDFVVKNRYVAYTFSINKEQNSANVLTKTEL